MIDGLRSFRPQKKRSFIQIAVIEGFIVISFLAVLLFILNYFNVVNIARFFNSGTQIMPNPNTQAGDLGTKNSTVPAQKAEEGMLYKYVTEVLNPALLPSVTPRENMNEIPKRHMNEIWMEWTASSGETIRGQLHTSRKGNVYMEDGLLLDMQVIIIDKKIKDEFNEIIAKPNLILDYFNVLGRKWNKISNENYEMYWENPHGFKDVRVVYADRWSAVDHGVLISCRVYKEFSPYYEKNTCIER